MPVTKRGETPWAGVKSWPAGSQAGDLAVLVSTPVLLRDAPAVSSLPSWSYAGEASYGAGAWAVLGLRWVSRIWVKAITDADLDDPPPALHGQLAVFAGAGPSVQASSGSLATVPAQGAVVGAAVSLGPIGGGPLSWLDQYVGVPPTWGVGRVGWLASATQQVVQVPGWMRLLVLSPPPGPLVPLLVAPTSGDVSSLEPVVLSWVYRSSVGGSQGAYRVAVTSVEDGTRWWTGTGWSATEVAVSSSLEATTIPIASLTVGRTYTWTVQTQEALDGKWSPVSATGSFMPVAPPVATVTGPSGVVMDDLSPTLTWTASTTEGRPVIAYEAQVVDTVTGRVVAASGATSSAALSWTAPSTTEWVRGRAYTVRVRVQQAGGAWSVWATGGFTIDWTPPPTPVVVATPAAEGTTISVSVLVPSAPFVLQRTHGEGWVDILAGEAAGTGLTVTDVWAEYGASTEWRCRQTGVVDGVAMVSDWGASGPVVSTDRHAYLADAASPLLTWQRIGVRSDSPRSTHQVVNVSYGLGDTHAVVWSEPEQGLTGTLTVRVRDRERTLLLRALLREADTLILRECPDVDIDTGLVVAVPPLWLAPADRWVQARLADLPLSMRDVTLPWVEQPPRPMGATTAPVTHPIEWTGDI